MVKITLKHSPRMDRAEAHLEDESFKTTIEGFAWWQLLDVAMRELTRKQESRVWEYNGSKPVSKSAYELEFHAFSSMDDVISCINELKFI